MSYELPTYEATRYLVPLREGGSLPAVVETDGGGLFVAKFRGAGQGAKALIAEVIVGRLAELLGLSMPSIARIDLDEEFGRSEPDPEIQDVLRGSRGANFGIAYLDGALNFDPVAAADLVTPEFASLLVWLDALVTNPDRGAKNPNLLVHDERLWLIDHGAAIYAHHHWDSVDEERTRSAFPLSSQHVLLGRASELQDVDARATRVLDTATLAEVLTTVPEAFLTDPVANPGGTGPDILRRRYLEYLTLRLREPREWVREAARAHLALEAEPPEALRARR